MEEDGAASDERLEIALECRRIVRLERRKQLALPARPFEKGSHGAIIGKSGSVDSQTPNPKSQTPNPKVSKLAIPSFLGVWVLGVGIWDFGGRGLPWHPAS